MKICVKLLCEIFFWRVLVLLHIIRNVSLRNVSLRNVSLYESPLIISLHSGGLPPGINLLNSGFTLPNASGGPGYIILSPGQNSPSFAPPLINMAQTTGASPIITMAMQNSESESGILCMFLMS